MRSTATSKKLLLCSLFFLSTTSITFAANYKDEVMPCPAIPTLNDGFYVGLQGGYDSYRVRQTDDIGVGTASTTSNSTGWVGGIFAGYGKDFNQFYLGGEAFANSSSASNTNSFNNTTGFSGSQKLSVNGSYGLAILPGFKLTNATMIYARLGYNWARLKATETFTGGGASYTASESHTSHGFAYGAGIETLVPEICDKLSVRAEYTHTNYNSFTPTGGQVNFSPSDNQAMLGLIYHI